MVAWPVFFENPPKAIMAKKNANYNVIKRSLSLGLTHFSKRPPHGLFNAWPKRWPFSLGARPQLCFRTAPEVSGPASG